MASAPIPPITVSTHPTPHAARLGYLGLAPFVLLAALVWLVRADAHPYVVDALAKYAAVIVSFLAGIHWGLAMRGGAAKMDKRFTWGVVPSLVAWIGVVMPPYAGLVVQGVTLIVCYLNDRRHYPAWGAAAWLTLRFRLTAIAALSCFVAAAGTTA